MTVHAAAVATNASPGEIATGFVVYTVIGAAIEAALVKIAIGSVTRYTIGYLRSLGVSLVCSVIGLVPFVMIVDRPAHQASTTIAGGATPGLWMLALPLSLLVIAFQAILTAELSEPRGADRMWTGYARAAGRI